MALFGIIFFSQICTVEAELVFWRVNESQSVELPCPTITERSLSHLHLYLYHRSPHSQSTLLSISQGDPPRVSPKHRGRLWMNASLHSGHINVTLRHLRTSDTGLYVWEMTENNSSRHFIYDQKIFLLVESTEKLCPCSSLYPRVLLIISAAAGLILLIICVLGIVHCVQANEHRALQAPAPIYVEMSRKEQPVPQNIPETRSHLEEARFPVYSNPNYRLQPQDNYYACPRQLKTQD